MLREVLNVEAVVDVDVDVEGWGYVLSLPGFLLFFLKRGTFQSLIPFRTFSTYSTAYFTTYFTSSIPGLKSKLFFHFFSLFPLFSTFFHLKSKIDFH